MSDTTETAPDDGSDDTSPIDDLLTELRVAHVRPLVGLHRRLRDEHADVATEVLAEVEDARVFAKHARFDAVVTGDSAASPKIFDLEPTPIPVDAEVAGIEVDINDVPCNIVRFAWNDCRVHVALPESAWERALREWLDQWLDPDVATPNADGVYEVVHAIRDASYTGGMLTFVVDFGSAGIYCVHDLLRAFLASGAESIVIGAPT